MMEDVKTSDLTKVAKRRHPKIENYMSTFKLFLKNKLALTGFTITIIYGVIAILDWVYPQYLGVPNIALDTVFLHGGITSASPTPPVFNQGWWYWFGTTISRIPIFPAMLAALKVDMTYTVFIVMVGASVGIIFGTMSGYFGGLFDEFLMRVTDIFFSIPQLVLAIAISFALGQGLFSLVIALIVVWWPIYARLTRGLGLSLKSQKYIEAAIASGSSGFRNVFKHVLPNVLSPVFVQISLDLGSVIQIFAAYRFIGLNAGNIYQPELGSLINLGLPYLAGGMWWATIIPSLFLLIFTVAVNLMGDGLRDVLDPRLRR